MTTSTLVLEQSRPYSNFINSIRTEATKKIYRHYLKKFIEFVGTDDILFTDNTHIEEKIIDYLLFLRSKNLSRQHIRCTFVAINHFYIMNDRNLNKNKIKRFIQFEEKRKNGGRKNKNQGYTSEQIGNLLGVCDERIKAMILLFASTGMRLAALTQLKIGDLELINNYNGSELYRVTVYSGYTEEYTTFCTPECTKVLKSYFDYRERSGEKLTEDSPVIREQFDPNDKRKSRQSRPLAVETIITTLRRKLLQCGMRSEEHTGDNSGARFRKEIPLVHGFRKFFNTALMNADVNPIFKELLMGHSVRLDDFYYDKNSEKSKQKLLDEYAKAIDNLTISEENRLGLKVQQLTAKADEMTQLWHTVESVKRDVAAITKKKD